MNVIKHNIIIKLMFLHIFYSFKKFLSKIRRIHIKSNLDETADVDPNIESIIIKVLRLHCLDNIYSKLAKPRYAILFFIFNLNASFS